MHERMYMSDSPTIQNFRDGKTIMVEPQVNRRDEETDCLIFILIFLREEYNPPFTLPSVVDAFIMCLCID